MRRIGETSGKSLNGSTKPGQLHIGQVRVDRRNAKSQASESTRATALLQVSDAGTQLADNLGMTFVDHTSPEGRRTPMFMICSKARY